MIEKEGMATNLKAHKCADRQVCKVAENSQNEARSDLKNAHRGEGRLASGGLGIRNLTNAFAGVIKQEPVDGLHA